VLVDVYRWTHVDWVEWTVATIAEQVFGQPCGFRDEAGVGSG
jgi:hypothetical protein